MNPGMARIAILKPFFDLLLADGLPPEPKKEDKGKLFAAADRAVSIKQFILPRFAHSDFLKLFFNNQLCKDAVCSSGRYPK